MMYPSLRRTPPLDEAFGSDGGPDEAPPGGPPTGVFGVSANVLYLGVTSLFTDVSTEMVNAILPLYLVTQLRFSYVEFGVFNGIYFGISGLMTIAGGVIADRRRRYKEVATAGYGVSAAAKVGLLATRSAPWPAAGVLFADRVGKGVRTAPHATR